MPSTNTRNIHTSRLSGLARYYPFGMMQEGRQFVGGIGYRYGFGSQETDNEVSGRGNSYTAEFWQYDSRLGRRWNVDPVLREYMSPFHVNYLSPISISDPNGADGIFKHKRYKVEAGEDGNVTYKIGRKEKGLEKMSERFRTAFTNEVDPIYKAMAKSTLGRDDIRSINNPDKRFRITSDNEYVPGANSDFMPLKFRKGYYYKVSIQVHLGNYDHLKTNNPELVTSREEWIGATMTVEIDHSLDYAYDIYKSLITNKKLSNHERRNNNDNIHTPGHKAFVAYYTKALNRAAMNKLVFRLENNISINNEVFNPIDRYNTDRSGNLLENRIPYSDFLNLFK